MNGFTLLETIITIGILLLIAGLITSSWPRLRERQALILAREELQVLFREAQQLSLNEKRSEECLETVGTSREEQRLCSDIGVAISGKTVRLFADTSGSDNQYGSHDFIVTERTLPLGVASDLDKWDSFLFKATPPSIALYGPNGQVISLPHQVHFILYAGDAERNIYVSPYGQLEE